MGNGNTAIHVLSELERIGWKYEYGADDNEIKVLCPVHADTRPSASIHIEKRVWNCQASGCMQRGDFISFLAAATKRTRRETVDDLATRYTITETKIIDVQTVERYHEAIWKAAPLLKELYARAITDEDIRKYRLGATQGRITIPIKNELGLYVNVRKYLPGAPGPEKMKNSRGQSKIRLFPYEQLAYDNVMICGGEMKAIVAARELNLKGWGAVCATAGEGNWEPSFNKEFKNKRVVVCLDVDDNGQKAAQARCLQLHRAASWLANLVLPLDRVEFPKGDINDFVASGKRLYPLLEKLEPYTPPRRVQKLDTPPEDVELSYAVHADAAGKRLRIKSVISAIGEAPYIIPREIKIECDRNQKECAVCPVYLDEQHEWTLNPESPSILEMVAAPKGVQRMAMMEGVGVPVTCPTCTPIALDYYNVEDTRISPQLEITNRASERVMLPAVIIGKGVELNEVYHLTGRMYPHPKTQQSTLLISNYVETQDALSTYKVKDLDALQIFQPVGSIEDKLTEIYADFEANVTRIFQRPDLHLTCDLAYHSPLLLNFDGKVEKGWVEVLIMGDSAQGKSETIKGLMNHYGLGEKVECKNASVAGLLGGLQTIGGRWYVTWGVIPTHDKRLVILEELKGASIEVISKLTDMRSSGVAEIPKIEKRRTHARTRLIGASNTRTGDRLATYNFGIDAVRELIGNLEDVRRFDFALLVAADEIDATQLNVLQQSRPFVPHCYTSELCRSLVLWTWTRTADQVVFDEAATRAVLEHATRLSQAFTDAIPLIDRGSVRLKLARLAAALAARLYSTDDGQRLIVTAEHVTYIADMLDRVYSSPIFGYRDYTDAIRMSDVLVDPKFVEKSIRDTPFPSDVVKSMLYTDNIDLVDLQDWCGWDRHQASTLLSVLVRKHALRRDLRSYRKTGPFIVMLKRMLEKNDFPIRPYHVEEEY